MTMGSEATAEIIPPPRRRAQAVQQAPLSDSAALLSAIEKAALNPQVEIGKVEQLLALYERIEGRRAEAAFNEALTAAQAASALLALSNLAGIAGQVNAADLSGSESYEQPEREIH